MRDLLIDIFVYLIVITALALAVFVFWRVLTS